MGDASQTSRITNADLALMIGNITGQITAIKQTTDKLDHAINGNGRPGLITDHRELKAKVEKVEEKIRNHLEDHSAEKKAVNEKKEKWNARTWAVFLIFVTQGVGLLVLFVRTGGIR